MRNSKFGIAQLTDTQQREARSIILKAKERHGGYKETAAALGIAMGTIASIGCGSIKAGKEVYRKLKEYERRTKHAVEG